jgi:hypothetical protein
MHTYIPDISESVRRLQDPVEHYIWRYHMYRSRITQSQWLLDRRIQAIAIFSECTPNIRISFVCRRVTIDGTLVKDFKQAMVCADICGLTTSATWTDFKKLVVLGRSDTGQTTCHERVFEQGSRILWSSISYFPTRHNQIVPPIRSFPPIVMVKYSEMTPAALWAIDAGKHEKHSMETLSRTGRNPCRRLTLPSPLPSLPPLVLLRRHRSQRLLRLLRGRRLLLHLSRCW